MATVQELIDRLNYLVDDTVPPTVAIDLFNSCLDEIATIAGCGRTAVAEFVAGQPMISLPADLVDLVELKIQTTSMRDYLRIESVALVTPEDVYDETWTLQSYGFEWFGNEVEIRPIPKEDGTLLIRYYHQPDHVRTVSDVPEIRPHFHRLLPLYGAAKYHQNWQNTEQMNVFWGEYLKARSELEEETVNRKIRTRSKSVYQYRVWR